MSDGSVTAYLPRVYKLWLAAALTSQLGDAWLFFGLTWAATAHGGAAAGLVLSAITFPRVTFLLLGGAVGDRVGARPVMILADAVMVVASLGLAAGVGLWGASLGLLVAAGAVLGTADAFYLPCSGSMPRRLVGVDLVPRALALRQSGMQLVALAGAPVGGLLVGVAGLGVAALADAATFAVILIVLTGIRQLQSAPEVKHRASLLREAVDGVRVAGTSEGMRAALLLTGGAAAFILPISSILLPLLARAHHWGAPQTGLILGGLAVGALSVSTAVTRGGIRPRPGRTALVGLLITAAGEMLVATSPGAGIAVVGAVTMGAGNGLFVTHLGPIILMTAPADYLARIQSLLVLIQSLTLLAASNLMGNLTRLLRPAPTILLSAGLLVGCAAIGACSPSLRRAEAQSVS